MQSTLIAPSVESHNALTAITLTLGPAQDLIQGLTDTRGRLKLHRARIGLTPEGRGRIGNKGEDTVRVDGNHVNDNYFFN